MLASRSANGRVRPGSKTGLRASADSIKYYFIIHEDVTMATSYSIGKHFEGFIESLIESGRYSTASEVMRDGLRLIEEREERRKAKLEALRAEIQKGFDSGPAEEIGDMFARIKAEGRKRLAAKNDK
ncbi:type II toxin-antitoxin system ParD family antitoxin [Bradyrhizobium sp.]|uniref:type II toxin-antitoxin system ParD family antitoxin n=1 Tax=Bradyrhizobium sp. TaxID=376 RepID=UPI003C72636E